MTGIVIARAGMLAAGVPLNIDWKQILQIGRAHV